jgi:hypothetical protein
MVASSNLASSSIEKPILMDGFLSCINVKHPGSVDQTFPGGFGEKRGRKMKRNENYSFTCIMIA